MYPVLMGGQMHGCALDSSITFVTTDGINLYVMELSGERIRMIE
ncbi:MAG: hypothetical protein NXI24_14360 [bacterium]|nr:hypothetical protein [bacterium]